MRLPSAVGRRAVRHGPAERRGDTRHRLAPTALTRALIVGVALLWAAGCTPTPSASPLPTTATSGPADMATPTDTAEVTALDAGWPAPYVAGRRAALPLVLHASAPPSAPPAPVSPAADDAAPSASAPVPTARATCPAGIATRDGDRLVVDGRPFTFFGINVQYLLDSAFPADQVEPLLADLAARDVNTARVWLLEHHDPERLASALDAGARHGVRFVVTLADNVDRGRDWFFGDEEEKVYRPHLERTVTRFKDRPEVLMWELVNEPSCGERFDEECVSTIKDWLAMTADHVKAIDPCHLVSTGQIGAGNFDFEVSAYRRLHRRDTIDILSAHRGVDQDRDSALAIAEEVDRPLFYGEVYAKAYDEGCGLLEGGKARGKRAEQVKDDLRGAIEDGVDGYLLWDFAAGQVKTADGTRDYCSVFGYELDDPLWPRLRAANLPASTPWHGSGG